MSTSINNRTPNITSSDLKLLNAKMNLQAFHRFLGIALLAITSVQASPHYGLSGRRFDLSPRDTVVTGQCASILVGNSNPPPNIGTVCVGLAGGTLTITYTITASGWTFNKVHAWVGTSPPTSTNPGTSPGQFPYSSDPGGVCTISGNTAVCTVSPIPTEWRSCTGSLYIVAHADVNQGTSQQTGWGNGTCYDPTQKGLCAKTFPVTKQCQCPLEIDFYPVTSTVR
jgi:hypothetical protein